MGKPSDQSPYRQRRPLVRTLKKKTTSKNYFSPRKWPGYAITGIGIIWRIVGFFGNFDFLYSLEGRFGNFSNWIVYIVLSPWFSIATIVVGVVYLVLIGEPEAGVQRQAWWPVIGWSVFVVCCTLILVSFSLTFGAFENQKALEEQAFIAAQEKKPFVIASVRFVALEPPSVFLKCAADPAPLPRPHISKTDLHGASEVATYVIQLQEHDASALAAADDCRNTLAELGILLKKQQEILVNSSK